MERTRLAHDRSANSADAAVDLDIFRDHFLTRKSLGVADAFFAPKSALSGMAQHQEIADERFFIIDVVAKARAACDFWQRRRITANDRATAGLRFNDWPAEAFKPRRIEHRDGQ